MEFDMKDPPLISFTSLLPEMSREPIRVSSRKDRNMCTYVCMTPLKVQRNLYVVEALQSPYIEWPLYINKGLCKGPLYRCSIKAPLQKGLCTYREDFYEVPRVFIHTYIDTWAHFSLFSYRYGGCFMKPY